MKNELIVILAHKRKTVADVHRETGVSQKNITDICYERTGDYDIKDIVKICDYLNVTLEQFIGIKIRAVRNQVGQRIGMTRLLEGLLN